MLVTVLIFRGDSTRCADPYLRLGHMGVRFGKSDEVYGFGPSFDHVVSPESDKTLVALGAFSKHTIIFERAVATGMPVFSLRAQVSHKKVRQRLAMLCYLNFALPTGDYAAMIRNGITNCVGAVRFLGIPLPGSSVLIRDMIQYASYERSLTNRANLNRRKKSHVALQKHPNQP